MNPFQVKDSFILTIFGASGDLAKIKLFPSLYQLMEQKRFPKKFFIVGYARTEKTREEFQKEFADSVRKKFKRDVKKEILDKLIQHVYYFTGDYKTQKDYNAYSDFLKTFVPKNKKRMPRLFYFSVPPQVFRPIVKNLGESDLSKRRKEIRLIIEKPFGEDAASATKLFHFIARYFDEDQVYLLDHYLGKSAVQSILFLRHSNRFLNLMMKGPEVANIQITAFEDIGVEDRIGYFDQVGMLKDMIQSHLLQLLSLITMSIPITATAKSIHREKENILASLSFPRTGNNVVLGQYESYRQQDGVSKRSNTPTFAALRFFINRESWYNVPIYIRTGKLLHEKHTYVVLELEKFKFQTKDEDPNRVIIEFYPDERITIKFLNRHGHTTAYQDVVTSDSIACEGDECLNEHGKLLIDVIRGDKMYFLSFPEIISSWKMVDAISRSIRNKKVRTERYKDGSEGPKSQHKLTKTDGFTWYDFHL